MINFKVKPDDGDPYEITATSRDVLVWEKAVRGKTFAQLVREQSMVDLYRIAHIASRRLGMFSGDLTEFEKTCEVEQGEAEPNEADPTRSGP